MVVNPGSYATNVRRAIGLGGYPEVNGALARDKAADLRKVVSSGADPLEQKRSANAAIDAAKTRTFRAAAEAWLKAKEEKGLAPSNLQKIRTYLDKDILPAFGDKPPRRNPPHRLCKSPCIPRSSRRSQRGGEVPHLD